MISTTNFMETMRQQMQLGMASKWLRRSVWGAIPLVAAISFYAISQVTPPKAINLSAEPLYAKGTGAKPTITLALSVEQPTVGAQYRDEYTVAKDYIGYFDINSCYTYDNNANPNLKKFVFARAATNHVCDGASFSGNFMNWATGSAIDVLRLGLTGGDRIVDTANMTVLQRAYIPGDFFNNAQYFPSKTLPVAEIAGAVPSSLVGNHKGDIKIANCFNRVHFGTAETTNNCSNVNENPGANSNLGTSVVLPTPPPPAGTINQTGALPGLLPNGFNSVSCANEGGNCNFTGSKYVAYGAGTKWSVGVFTGSVNCRNGVFGDPAPGTPKKCYIGVDWVAPAGVTTTSITSDKFFYTRVQVCDATDPRTRSVNGFCQRQPAGNFKPVGNLQRYSDRVRVAAFGYLKDDTIERYGGVLRAPMKYIGPKAYDASGALLPNTNPKLEWDISTGVFNANPEGATENKSGVINYVNQFGRTATVPGSYKSKDPVTELYYEALRYIQGLPPTDEATTGFTEVMKDGFPVYNAANLWVDPHAGGDSSKDYSCLKNNIVVIGDIFTHRDKNIPGNTRVSEGDTARPFDLAANVPNFKYWTSVVGGFESNNSISYTFQQEQKGTTPPTYLPITATTSNPNSKTATAPGVTPATAPNATINTIRSGMEDQGTGSAGSASYYMAGMAYWGNTQDIRGKTWTAEPSKQRPGMRSKTYVIDVNESSASNNQTTRRNSQFFLTAKYGGFTDNSNLGNPYLNAGGTLDNNNWQKANDPGQPKTYFVASSAQAVLDGINEIFQSVTSDGNSLANGSISTTSFQQGGFVYNAKFDPTDWSGDVISTPVGVTGTAINLAVDKPQWQAAKVMNANNQAYFKNTRKIVAGRSDGNKSGDSAIDFNWASVSGDSGTMKDGMNNVSTATPSGDNLGESRLEYLRGVKENEGITFRTRKSLLGDIVNSPVVYSKAFLDTASTEAYRTFKTNNKDRPGALFVGANDGMFHSFHAETGAELFAYIPSWLASKLPALSDPNYNSSRHQSYVDGLTDVSEAQVGTDWKTVLLSSTGGGGQGVFALDVSDPSKFDKTKVMWEFTDRDDADLGNVMGTPRVVKMRTNAKSESPAKYEWFAVVPSGVNNFVEDGYVSNSKKPHLFLLSLNKSAGQTWALGTNYYKFEIPAVANLSNTVSPGVINFDAITGLEGEIDLVYMGDLHGNLWKLDFDTASSTRKLSEVTFTDLISNTSSKPLFVATDKDGNVQPIAMTPKLVFGPNRSTIVMFGTGKYLEVTDNNLEPIRTQSVYAINDIEVGGSKPKFVESRDYLEKGQSSAGVISINSFVWGRASKKNDKDERSGWFFDYATNGERSVSDFTVAGLNIYFGSVVPPQNLTDPCSGGGGNIYAINFATGNGTASASEVGLIGQIFVQKTIASTISNSDSTGRRTESTTERLLIKGTEGYQLPPTDIKNVSALGRLSWRQINNYDELRNEK
jgi:type IV pilus assembly protein PilY1